MNTKKVMVILFLTWIIVSAFLVCLDLLPLYFDKRRRRNRAKRILHELRFSAQNVGGPKFAAPEEAQTTRCDECGRQFLFVSTTDETKRPFVCNCGNKLTWKIPYTRIEIENDEKIDYINLRHQKGWYYKLTNIVNIELDDNVKSIVIRK